jgi:lipopolysaccharide biosynthesis glycosyltransferase
MDIAFCINDSFIPFITVVMKSVMENNQNSSVSFYVLIDKISNKNRRALDRVVDGHKNYKCFIIRIDDERVEGLRIGKLHHCIWYRVLLPDYLPFHVEKVLYLDADTLVLGELESLFKMDLDGMALAGGLDPLNFSQTTFGRLGYGKENHYICSGVMLINLRFWRDNGITDKIIRFASIHRDLIQYPDQDAINSVNAGKIVYLPLRYAIMDCFLTKYKSEGWFSKRELMDCLQDPRIVHFAGNAPWKREYAHRLFHDDWQRYNRMLKYPVKMKYETKGLSLAKMLLWGLAHSKGEKCEWNSKEEVLKQLSLLQD